MRLINITARRLTMGLAMITALLSPLATSAQSQLDVGQAQAFMGNWVIAIESDFGPFTMNLELTDQGGKVAASIGSPELGGMQSITDISRDGEGLVLAWEMDAQGQIVDATMTLDPNGENLDASFEAAGGQFMADGVGTRSGS
jgi:hypothetical protein